MTLKSAFLCSNTLLAGLALSCLILSGIYSPTTGLILYAGLALCLALEQNEHIPLQTTPRILSSYWAFLMLPFLFFAFNLPLRELLAGFLVYLLFARFIFKSEFNDYLFGYLIAIVCLLIGAIFEQNLTFGFIFLSFNLVLSWCLILYTLMWEQYQSGGPLRDFKKTGKNKTPGSALLVWSTGFVILSFCMTAVIFISFPRFGLGFISLNTPSSPITGFSDTVTLGDVGKIKQNPAVVMRVEYSKGGKNYKPRSQIFWRGVVLDHYNGRTWTSTLGTEFETRNRPGTGLNLFRISSPKEVVQQNIFMESFNAPYLFTHGTPLFIDGNFIHVQMDKNFVFKTRDTRSGPRKYTLISEISDPDISYSLDMPHNEPLLFPGRFLQLPDISHQIYDLADRLTRSVSTDKNRARNILNHFNDFKYTLKMENDPDKTALEHFLFKRKEGHCEYFASAMVILLRSAGVPARLVNGFVGVEWNDLGNYLIIRQQHAHSWVEAFIPGKGWTVYDPTPPDPALVNLSQLHPLAKSLDFLRMSWQRYVVRYSVQDQAQVMDFFRTGGRDIMQKLKDLTSLNWKSLGQEAQTYSPVLLILILVTIFSLFLKRRFGWQGFTLSSRPPLSVMLYKDMLRQLKKSGLQKKDSWTAQEFLASALPDSKRDPIRRITEFYELHRFGNSTIHPSKEKEIRELIAML
jgi:protein-glutamine gamma-glutamyltransferase